MESLLEADARSNGRTTRTSELGEIFEMNTANSPIDIRTKEVQVNLYEVLD